MSLTYGQIESALQAAIAASLPDSDDDNWVWVTDFSDAFVVYYQDGQYFQDDYEIDDDGNVTLAGNPVTVKQVTTYEPLDDAKGRRGPLEMRGMPPQLRAAIEQRRSPHLEIRAEPLTYREDVRESYFRDFLLKDAVAGAEERLERHASEMRTLAEARERSALRRMDEAGFEYRVEPNRTDGQGGYFSPPIWLNELFATGKHAERVLASLIPARFPLPPGVSQINLPILGGTGTAVQPTADNEAAAEKAITDSAGSCNVVTLDGMADVALQLLEQSPPGAHTDWVIFKDLMESYGAQLETQLLAGTGSAATGGGDNQILGVTNVSGIVNVTYTSGSPTGSTMYPYFGQAMGQLADGRIMRPEVWLMRTARWAWIATQEDTAGLPLGIASPFFMGSDPTTPDPIGGLVGLPVFADEAIPATLGGTPGTQDEVICLRPSDLILFEGDAQTTIALEPLSGSLGARIVMHRYAAAITNRYPSGIAVAAGTGFAVQSGF